MTSSAERDKIIGMIIGGDAPQCYMMDLQALPAIAQQHTFVAVAFLNQGANSRPVAAPLSYLTACPVRTERAKPALHPVRLLFGGRDFRTYTRKFSRVYTLPCSHKPTSILAVTSPIAERAIGVGRLAVEWFAAITAAVLDFLVSCLCIACPRTKRARFALNKLIARIQKPLAAAWANTADFLTVGAKSREPRSCLEFLSATLANLNSHILIILTKWRFAKW